MVDLSSSHNEPHGKRAGNPDCSSIPRKLFAYFLHEAFLQLFAKRSTWVRALSLFSVVTKKVARKALRCHQGRDRHLLHAHGPSFLPIPASWKRNFFDRIAKPLIRALFWDVVKSIVLPDAELMHGRPRRKSCSDANTLPSARRLAVLFRKPLQVWSKQLLRILNSLSFATLLRACPARRAISLLLIALLLARPIS